MHNIHEPDNDPRFEDALTERRSPDRLGCLVFACIIWWTAFFTLLIAWVRSQP
jgi:hypothetical protein